MTDRWYLESATSGWSRLTQHQKYLFFELGRRRVTMQKDHVAFFNGRICETMGLAQKSKHLHLAVFKYKAQLRNILNSVRAPIDNAELEPR